MLDRVSLLSNELKNLGKAAIHILVKLHVIEFLYLVNKNVLVTQYTFSLLERMCYLFNTSVFDDCRFYRVFPRCSRGQVSFIIANIP